MSTRSEEGFADEGQEEGALLCRVDGADVRESTWAGAYYCAHVLYVAARDATSPTTTVKRDKSGDALVGFLHVPADPESTGGDRRPPPERHARTTRVLACALRGFVDEIGGDETRPARVLATGFGPFAAVVSNPTGDLIEDRACVAAAMTAATGEEPRDLAPLERLSLHQAGDLLLARLCLDVADDSLDPKRAGSLPWAVATFAPHAIVSLGVHRASSSYRVEIEPTNAGLCLVDGQAPRHERGRAVDVREPMNRALARAVVAGARALGF